MSKDTVSVNINIMDGYDEPIRMPRKWAKELVKQGFLLSETGSSNFLGTFHEILNTNNIEDKNVLLAAQLLYTILKEYKHE